ncbi:MAG: TetR/AcrR family transcriptional regulator [Parvibaculaceae bacterium]|nr:TetR/AcrR family transcriptional regulator [Parvibaculaceae bacterium]
MNKGPDKRQLSDEKRETIRQIIISLFADSLYQDVGIRDICTQAGVTPKTIYKHFGNKDALLISAISPDMKRLNLALSVASQTSPTLIDNLQAMSQAFFRFYFENIAIARIMFLNIPSAYLVSKPEFIQSVQLGILRDLIVQGQKTEFIRQDIDASELTEAVAGLTMRSMFRYLTVSTSLPTPEEAADKISLLSTPMLLNPAFGEA